MKIKYKITGIIYLTCIFTFYSCALSDFEHENNLILNLSDREYSVEYIQFLDSDLVPFFYPEKISSWETVRQPNESKFHLRKYLSYSETLPSTFRIHEASLDSISDKEIFYSLVNNEIVMKKPITVSSSNYFVMKNFVIEGTFSGRNIPEALNPLINDDDEDIDKIEDIINQLIGFMYIETINNSDIEFNQKHIFLNSVKNYSNELEYDVSLFDLDMSTLNEIISIAEQHLMSIIDEKNRQSVVDTWSSIKSDLMVSMLLIFNDFKIKAYLPGSISSSNADLSDGDTLTWSIDINDINGKDYQIQAASRIIHKDRMFILALGAILSILGLLVMWIKSE